MGDYKDLHMPHPAQPGAYGPAVQGPAPRNGLLRKAWRFVWGCAPQDGMLLRKRVLLTQWAPLQRHKVQDQAKCGGSLVLQRQSLIVYGSAPWGMGPTGRCRWAPAS
jgi:hypothetical protein